MKESMNLLVAQHQYIMIMADSLEEHAKHMLLPFGGTRPIYDDNSWFPSLIKIALGCNCLSSFPFPYSILPNSDF